MSNIIEVLWFWANHGWNIVYVVDDDDCYSLKAQRSGSVQHPKCTVALIPVQFYYGRPYLLKNI